MKYSELKNEELLALYKNLDKDAFNEFFRRNSPIVFSFVASRLNNNSEAEEVMQDTFFRIHKYVLKYDPQQNAMSWIFTIARNCLLDQISKRKKHTELKQEMQSHQELQSVETRFQEEAKDHLDHLLNSLDPDDRRLLEDRFLNEESYETLAKELGVSPAGVRQRLSRIVRKLRENL